MEPSSVLVYECPVACQVEWDGRQTGGVVSPYQRDRSSRLNSVFEEEEYYARMSEPKRKPSCPVCGSANRNGKVGVEYEIDVCLEPMECDDCGARPGASQDLHAATRS